MPITHTFAGVRKWSRTASSPPRKLLRCTTCVTTRRTRRRIYQGAKKNSGYHGGGAVGASRVPTASLGVDFGGKGFRGEMLYISDVYENAASCMETPETKTAFVTLYGKGLHVTCMVETPTSCWYSIYSSSNTSSEARVDQPRSLFSES